MGDPPEIKAKRVKKQKFDREDARLLRRLMLENNFPQIWVPSPENRDLRQLLWHRHRLVQMRTRIMNQLQAVAMNEGNRWKKKAVQRTRTNPVGEARVGSLGQSAAARTVLVARPINPTIEEFGTRFPFVLAKTSVGSKCISVMHRFEDRPSISCSPPICFQKDVSKVWAVGPRSNQPSLTRGRR